MFHLALSVAHRKCAPKGNLFSLSDMVCPFALANFCILGWFIGQGRATIALRCRYFSISPIWDWALVCLSLGMTADGVGLSALIAEFSAVLLGGLLVLQRLRK
jgi:hypothetical protein